jgi:acyl-CoA synthetase (AMP-forming)/AMP-acid ligase II
VDSERVSFQDLQRACLDYAGRLRDLGVGPGDRIGILMPNSLAWVQTLLASSMLGAVVVPLNTRYELDELRYVAGHAELHTLVTTAQRAGSTDFEELTRRSLPEAWGGDPPDGYERLPLRHVLIDRADGSGPAPSFDAVLPAAHAVRPTDLATVLYTSGTTSRPKGCLMSHEALVRTGVARFEERRVAPEPLTVWTPCPLFHVGALVPLLGCLASGATFVTSTRFDPAEALATLEREHVTTALPLFSAFTDAMLDHPAFAGVDLSRLRDILTTGPASGVERAQRAFAPAKLVAGYGMTELCGVAASSPVDEPDEERLVWTGRPFGGIEMAIVDPDSGRALPPGCLGEIVARGYCTVTAYLHDDKATAAAFDDEGWFHTGDMGIAAPDGRIAFRGRYKDMLKVGGENVSALEVEEYLGRHPAVRRAEVVGMPDGRLDEVVAAFVELEPGQAASPEEIIAYCQGRIARFKVPRLVRFVPQERWPMSATKVDKVTLRRWAAEPQ